MKKILSLLLCLALVFACCILSSCGGGNDSENDFYSSLKANGYEKLKAELKGNYNVESLKGTQLNVFNWGDYMSVNDADSINVNKAFEQITGIKVNYTTYDSNEQMYSKLSSGAVAYDVLIPSDYMIERMKNENMLKKLDFSKITNYGNIYDKYKNIYFDEKNEYSVPYNVGMVGLIYNKTMVEEPVDSWKIMWDEKYKDQILNFDNQRDAFMIAQYVLGIDLNTTNKADWDKAADKLIEEKPLVQEWVMDQVFNKMEGGNAAIAPYYAGDYLTMKENNEDLEFVYPKEGTNIFVDSFCVPECTQNYEAALLYINFMLETDIALANAECLRYASPNKTVVESDNYSLKGNKILYPDEKDMPKVEYYHDLDKNIRTYYEQTLWEKIKKS